MKEKLILGAIGTLVLLHVHNTITMNKTLEGVKIIREEIEPLKEEIEVIRKETKEIKKDVNEIKSDIYLVQENISLTKQEKECLARNIFFEAGVESIEGKIAVAQVTLNRMKSKRWGKNLCDVVYAKKQFSWTIQPKKRYSTPKGKLWLESLKAKQMFLEGQRIKGLEESLHYHTDYIIQPKWAKTMPAAKKVGQHIFYSM